MTRQRLTTTGGREATTKRIAGDLALSVGLTDLAAPTGWKWVPLTSVARMESGHTPSRKRAEYWGGEIPWIGIKDAKRFHGDEINETLETTNELGIANSSARVLPKGTVCLSRTASVGYVVKMGRDMATSQDFANWVCSDSLDPDYLVHLLLAEAAALSRFSSGSVHQTIYYPELKAFHICLPPLEEQRRIVAILDEAFEGLERARANAEANLASARELFDSYIRIAFDQSEWPVRFLPSISENLDRVRVPITKGDRVPGDIPYYGASGIVDHVAEYLFDEDLLLVSEDGANLLARKYPIAFSISGKSWVNNHVHVLRFSDLDTQEYVRLYLNSVSLQPYVSGMAQPKLNQAQLNRIPIPFPDLQHRQEVVADAATLASESHELQTRYEVVTKDLADLRRSLLHKAFAGELT